MIIYTAKFSKKKAVAILVAIAVIIAAVILAAPDKEVMGRESFAAKGVRSGESVREYIGSLGYEAEAEPRVCREVTIPRSFDAVYERYNAMQKDCGFDLEGYKGKSATLYTYALTDYPDESGEVLCDVLICKGKVIGGNIYTLALDGFMHGLMPKG